MDSLHLSLLHSLPQFLQMSVLSMALKLLQVESCINFHAFHRLVVHLFPVGQVFFLGVSLLIAA